MTRDEMEARRLEARRMLIAGRKPSLVMKHAGVSRTTVDRWRAALELGSDLRKRKVPGRPPKVSLAFIRQFYRPGMRYATLQNIIGVKLGVSLCADHVGRLLHKAGLVKKREKREAA